MATTVTLLNTLQRQSGWYSSWYSAGMVEPLITVFTTL